MNQECSKRPRVPAKHWSIHGAIVPRSTDGGGSGSSVGGTRETVAPSGPYQNRRRAENAEYVEAVRRSSVNHCGRAEGAKGNAMVGNKLCGMT